MPDDETAGTEHFLPMKALIIYDDFTAAAKASATLHHPAQFQNLGVRWNVMPWRADLLKFSPTAKTAMAEAMDAHLVVFAGRCAQSIPVWLQNWLEHWAKCRHVADAALAVMGNDASSISVSGELPRFAARHGLHFLFDGNAAAIASAREERSSFATGMKNEEPANACHARMAA